MTGLILKLSYNNVGETPVTGGICGSFFFINKNFIATANHILNKADFKPNDGFSKCQFWLLIQPDIVIELSLDDLIEYPEIDSTFIKLDKDYNIAIRAISTSEIQVGKLCFNEGFIGGQMPGINANWGSDRLIISGCSYNSTITQGEGTIKSLKSMDINAEDIKMKGIRGLETSYGGMQGMSGGPLIDRETNEIIGLMSIGLPADLQVKQTLFAVAISQLIEKIDNVA